MPARHPRQPRRAAVRRTAAAGATAVASIIGAAALPPGTAVAADNPETAYLHAINAERQSHGLAPLVPRHSLNVVADAWAAHMATSGTLAHNPNLASSVSNWQSVGENVGMGPDVASLDNAFWNSSAHRANILDPSYQDVGIGAVQSQGVIWITVDFRDPLHPVQHSAARSHRSRSTHHARPAHRSGTSAHASNRTHRRAQRQQHQHRTLRYGSVGRDVAQVQRRLGVAADGIFGPITQAAVRRFQRHHDHRPTGVVGPRTWRALHA
jgi:uncharacterized protein YkwD